VESHGVSNMLRLYLEAYANGVINPTPNWTVVRERLATANIESDRGLGLVIAPKAMEIAIEKARQTGMGVVTMTNGGHVGMAAYHAMLALPHDMIGMCMTAANPSVIPTFGKEPRLGTNPIAFAAPAKEEPAFVFDMATSVVPVNKVRNVKRAGALLPPGLIATADGTPVMEPALVPDSFLMLPLGSSPEMASHKGYGLGSVVEILCSVLAGAGFGARNARTDYRHFVAAYNIDAFSDVGEFKSTMDDFIRTLKATAPAEGHDRVLVAGQPEWEAQEERLANGIPLHREVVDWFHEACSERGVDCLF
ncbi:MAG: Ldh family oxidoreductase, partial [Dehalococcoidia bacterium]